MKGKIDRKVFAVMLCIGYICSCSLQHSLEPQEYIKWVENPENGMQSEKRIDAYDFKLQYRPVDYMVARDMINEPGINVDSVYGKYNGLQYFILKIGAPASGKDFLLQSIQDEQEYYARIQYFNAEAQEDIYLVEGTDTLRCVFYHFERTYSISSYNNLLLGFENKSKLPVTKTVYYNDRVLGTGKVILTIPENQLKRIPKLTTI